MTVARLNLLYIGSVWKNCGPTGGQTNALKSDEAFRNMLTTNYSQVFGQNQALFQNLTSNLGELLAAGPGQQGYTAPELAAKNSQAINDASASNQKLQTVIGENGVRGSATPGVESGVEQAERSAAATQVDTGLNNTLSNITTANYDTGRQNYWSAVQGDEAAPGAFENPTTQLAGQVNNANAGTGSQANQNAQDSTGNELLGLGEGLAADAATAAKSFSQPPCWIAAAVFDGWDDPRVNEARNFIFNIWAKESILGSLVAKLYTKIGRQVAFFVEKSSILRRLFKPLFETAVRKNRQ